MKILKIFNNNTVATFSNEKTEMIVTGPGIGFKKNVGDLIDETKIQKRYIIENDQKESFYKLLEKTPIEYFDISENICKKANKEFSGGVSSQFVMMLADHIAFAIKRKKENVEIPNLLLSETQTLYPKEYEIGLWALRYIHARCNIQLPESEAGFIAIHLININHLSKDAYAVLDFCKNVVYVVESVLGRKLDFNKFNEKRFYTHLKYLGQRIFLHSEIIDDQPVDQRFIQKVLSQSSKTKECLNKIENYVKTHYNYRIKESEMFYLMIHLYKLME